MLATAPFCVDGQLPAHPCELPGNGRLRRCRDPADGFLKSPDGKPASLTQATPGCKQTPLWSKVPTEFVLNSAYEHLNRSINDSTAAPAAPQFERNADGSLKRNADGELLGGIRLPQSCSTDGKEFWIQLRPRCTCMLAGFHHDYTLAELKARYHDHAGYVREVEKATEAFLTAGFILASPMPNIFGGPWLHRMFRTRINAPSTISRFRNCCVWTHRGMGVSLRHVS